MRVGPLAVELPSGCTVERPAERLLRFCRAEYAYYDAIPSANPDRIEPLDVLAAVAVNTFFPANASTVRRIHHTLSASCNPLLPQIPVDADLLSVDSLGPVYSLLNEAIQQRGVLIPTATKVLHRKRPHLIPMLDSVVLRYYLEMPPAHSFGAAENKRLAAGAALLVLKRFRDDLRGVLAEVETTRSALAAEGYSLTHVRILELLVWTEIEPHGYYRT